jgi:hypothetical protein
MTSTDGFCDCATLAQSDGHTDAITKLLSSVFSKTKKFQRLNVFKFANNVFVFTKDNP